MPAGLTVQPDGQSDTGICQCCGGQSRTVWGYVRTNGVPRASYYVHWTIDQIGKHGAHWDIIIGAWGEGTGRADRYNVRLEYRILDTGPAFLVIDAKLAHKDMRAISGRALSREEVMGTPIAAEVFAICDAAIEQDERLISLAVWALSKSRHRPFPQLLRFDLPKSLGPKIYLP